MESWTINLDITPATNDATLSDTSTLDDQSSSLTTDNNKQSESSTDEEAVGFTGLLV